VCGWVPSAGQVSLYVSVRWGDPVFYATRTPALGDGDAEISALLTSSSGAKGARSGITFDDLVASTAVAASQKPRDKHRDRPVVMRSTSCRPPAWD